MIYCKRIIYLDVIRVLACVMVIVQHLPMPGRVNSVLLSATSFLTYPCCPLFFMVSGALLLPVKTASLGSFLCKRLLKVLYPTLFWTFFYLLVKMVKNEPISLINVLSIPFSAQGSGVLWFMYVLIGLYLISPIISPWLISSSKREVRFFLLLWGVTLFFTHVDGVLEIATGYNNMLYYFSGYIGYFLLGYYLHHYVKYERMELLYVLFMFCGPIVVYGVLKYLDVELLFSAYTSILTALMSVAWFLGIKNLSILHYFSSKGFTGAMERISNLSFGIYLMHYFILSEVSWWICVILSDNSTVQIFLAFLVTFVLCILVCCFISKLPISQYIIGYKHK